MIKIDKRSKAYRDACKTSAGEVVEIVVAKDTQVGGDHYLCMGIQPWDAMQTWMTAEQYVGFLRGNSLKYLARCDAKGGLEDIKKAHHYLSELIRYSEGLR